MEYKSDIEIDPERTENSESLLHFQLSCPILHLALTHRPYLKSIHVRFSKVFM